MSTALAVLAAATPTKTPTGGEGVKSGPWGLAIILLLCVAAYFLFKSMSKHMRKVREQFPVDGGGADAAGRRTASPGRHLPTSDAPPAPAPGPARSGPGRGAPAERSQPDDPSGAEGR